MGLAAGPGGRLADRFDPRRVITIGLLLVAVAGGLRAIAPGYPALVGLTILFGLGIGISQPSFPRIGRGLLPTRIGLATGVYAAGFFFGAVLAAFLTAPVLLPLISDTAWGLPLAVWGVLGLISLVVWLLSLKSWNLRSLPVRGQVASLSAAAKAWSPWRDRKAWIVAGVFAGQGLCYYLLVAWLPSVHEEAGVSESQAGLIFAVFQLATFPAMVGLPILSDRIHSRRIPTLLASIAFLIGSTALALNPGGDLLRWIAPVLAGFGVAGLFGMGLLMPADVAPAGRTGSSAGMVLGIGYLASGLGPIVGGVIRDVTGSYDTALALLPVVAIGLIGLSFFVPDPWAPLASIEPESLPTAL